jgi:hypothetical protein
MKGNPGSDGSFGRDLALCNKSSDSIDPRVGIPPNWIQTLSPKAGKAKKVDPPEEAAVIEPVDPKRRPTTGPYPDEEDDDFRKVGQGPKNQALSKVYPDFDARESTSAKSKRFFK